MAGLCGVFGALSTQVLGGTKKPKEEEKQTHRRMALTFLEETAQP